MLGFLGRVGLHFYSTTSLWTPALLFAAGEPGVWYDPSDFSTMFTDAAGTTPVTAVEQPVGLLLDKSKGLALGAELVTNGDFASDTAWVKGAGWTITGGKAVATAVAAFVAIDQSVSIVSGKRYWVTCDTTVTAGGAALYLGAAGDSTVEIVMTATGSYRQLITATATATLIIRARGSGFTGTIDNVSVRELPGNHASQSTAASRPVLSARVNLLTRTEDFRNTAAAGETRPWIWSNASITTNTAVAPDGTTTADTVTSSAGYGAVYQTVTGVSGVGYTASIFVKKTSGALSYYPLFQCGMSGTFRAVIINTTAGTLSAVTGGSYVAPVAQSCNSSSDGNYWVVSLSFNAVGTSINFEFYPAASADGSTLSGGVTGSQIIWGADLRVTNVGSNMPAYQRVGAATYGTSTVAGNPDYDTTGFPFFLVFNGSNRFMVSSTITPGTDKTQLFAGTRKLSDAAQAFLVEYSPNVGVNDGSLCLQAPGNVAGPSYFWTSKGTSRADAVTTSFAAPITNVVTGLGDISGDTATLRVNGAQQAQTTTDQGTGNFLSYPLYIGMRNGANNPFDGNLYSLIVRFGPNLSEATIDQTEVWVGDKTGLNLSFATQQTIFDRFNATVLNRLSDIILQRY